jgi:hypothetical protein
VITGTFLMGTGGVKRSGREDSVSSPCSVRFRMSGTLPLLLLYTLQRGQRKLFSPLLYSCTVVYIVFLIQCYMHIAY